jgi:hypothetical protein
VGFVAAMATKGVCSTLWRDVFSFALKDSVVCSSSCKHCITINRFVARIQFFMRPATDELCSEGEKIGTCESSVVWSLSVSDKRKQQKQFIKLQRRFFLVLVR